MAAVTVGMREADNVPASSDQSCGRMLRERKGAIYIMRGTVGKAEGKQPWTTLGPTEDAERGATKEKRS